MALDPRPLAHATEGVGRARPMSVGAFTLATLLGAAAAIAAPAAFEPVTAPYLAAAASREVGTVTGRVFEERRRPDGPDAPFVGAAVTLLPRSAEFMRRLEGIKQTARSSVHTYRAAAPAILALRASYEKELWSAGAADLVRATAAGTDGRFTVENVPAGDWVLLATHTVRSESQSRGTTSSSKKRSAHTPGTRLTGYREVVVWLREIRMASRAVQSVELTDRGVWFSGIVEDRVPDAGR
jgi:hypothetical protein